MIESLGAKIRQNFGKSNRSTLPVRQNGQAPAFYRNYVSTKCSCLRPPLPSPPPRGYPRRRQGGGGEGGWDGARWPFATWEGGGEEGRGSRVLSLLLLLLHCIPFAFTPILVAGFLVCSTHTHTHTHTHAHTHTLTHAHSSQPCVCVNVSDMIKKTRRGRKAYGTNSQVMPVPLNCISVALGFWQLWLSILCVTLTYYCWYNWPTLWPTSRSCWVIFIG